ncbi:MAG: hypothetical protein AAF799_20160 [Myxococcota bacterium]
MKPAYLSLLFGASLVAGCATGRGDRALRHERYADALEAYDEALRRRPGHAKLEQRRQEAREGWTRERLAEVGRLRGGRHIEASARVNELLERTREWTLRAELSGRLTAEVEASARQDHERARRVLQDHGPLAAEATLPQGSALLREPVYDAVRAETAAEILAAGQQRCRDLAGSTDPFVVTLAGFYCHHFHAPIPAPPARPDACATIGFEGSIDGETPAEAHALRKELTWAFRHGPYYDPRAACTIRVTLDGTRAESHSVRAVTLHAQWEESEPYQATVYERVPYQETEWYTDRESYTESEPYQDRESYTTYRSENYSCGWSPPQTCTRSVPHTEYRLVTKYRTVTKYRNVRRSRLVTKYREEARLVTEYRSVPRTFSYPANEHVFSYDSVVSMRVGLAPAVLESYREADTRTSHEHEVTFAPAEVRPTAATAPRRSDRFASELAKARARLQTALSEAFLKRHCDLSIDFDADAAAACLLSRPRRIPKAARAALQAQFRDDPGAIARLLPDNPWVPPRDG